MCSSSSLLRRHRKAVHRFYMEPSYTRMLITKMKTVCAFGDSGRQF
jgi:hypothetical protein